MDTLIIVLISAFVACVINQMWHVRVVLKALNEPNPKLVNRTAGIKFLTNILAAPITLTIYTIIAVLTFALTYACVYGIVTITGW